MLFAYSSVVAHDGPMNDSEVYTHGHHDSVLRSHRSRTAENSAAYLLGHLRSGLDVLDVGCGPGTITVDLATRTAPGRTVAVDRAESVVEEAAALARARGVTVDWRVGDAYALDEADDSFDVVHAHQVLQHLQDPVAALREWGRVVRPGGLIAARDSDYGGFRWFPAVPELDGWLSLYQRAARANGGEPDAGVHLLAWAHAAGFTDVGATASAWCFATADDRGWWASLWADRITQSALASQLERDGLADRAQLEAIAAAWRRWAEHPDAWITIPHGEVLIRVG
jgi:SAM-dependent methyltransferase